MVLYSPNVNMATCILLETSGRLGRDDFGEVAWWFKALSRSQGEKHGPVCT